MADKCTYPACGCDAGGRFYDALTGVTITTCRIDGAEKRPNPRKECDWESAEGFSVAAARGEHDPCWVVMPGGSMIALNHSAGTGVDMARAQLIADACNEKLENENG